MANTATSIYFDAGDDILLVDDTTIGRIGDDENPGPFTLETWVKVDGDSYGSGTTRQGIASRRGAGHSSTEDGGWFWDIQSSRMQFGGNFGSESWLHGGGTGHVDCTFPTDNAWHHCVVERIGDANVNPHFYVLFIDGELKEIFNKNGTGGNFLRSADTDKMCIGNNSFENEADTDFHGYMDEFRFSHTARYGNIDIPTAPLSTSQTAGRGKNTILPHHVKLLVQANSSTTTSDIPSDLSGNFVADASNRASFGQTQTQLGNCAIYFDGTTGLNFPVAASTDLDWSGDWSYEAWVYSTHTSASHTWWWGQSAGGTGPNNAWFFQLHPVNQNGGIYSSGTGTNEQYSETLYHTTHNTNQWEHWVMGIVDDNWYIFKDGQLFMQRPTSSLYRPAQSTRPFFIGRRESGTSIFSGFMDNIRICCGESAYTPHFNPYGGQKNVVHNRGGAITDARLASANTHAIQMGRAAIGSDAATNANTYCLDFDGTNDYLVHHTTNWRADDDRGTIFAWIYLDNNPGTSYETILSSGDTATVNFNAQFVIDNAGKPRFYNYNSGTDSDNTGVIASSALSNSFDGAWRSIAVTAGGTADSTIIYVDGSAISTAEAPGTDKGAWFSHSPTQRDNVIIGAYKYSGTASHLIDGKIMQVAYWGGSSGTAGVLDADAIAALHAAGKSYDIKGSGNTGNYDSWTADLKGYWRMGNHYLDTADTIYDASGNGYDMHQVSNPPALTWSTGTTFLNNWQHRGYFTPDKYTSLLIQSSTSQGATTFTDSGPGFKRTLFDGTNDYASKTVSDWQGSDDRGTIIAWVKLGATTEEIIFSKSDTAGDDDYMMFYVEGGKVKIQFKDSGAVSGPATEYGYGNQTVTAGAWTCLAWVSDGTNWTTYVNGVADTSWTSQYGNPADRPNTGRWLGDVQGADNITVCGLIRSGVYSAKMEGQMSQIAVWGGSSGTTGVLTAAQILAIHDLGPGADLTTDYASGMVGYWTFGNKITEGTDDASTIYDQSAGSDDNLTGTSLAAPFAGHTITGQNSIYHSTAKSVFGGSSIYFDGSDDHLTIPASPDFNFAGQFTIEFWTYVISKDDNGEGFISFDVDGAAANRDLVIGYKSSSSNKLSFMSNAYDETTIVESEDGVSTGSWHHVAVARDADNIVSMYINGQFKGSGTWTTAHVTGSDGVFIGQQYAGSQNHQRKPNIYMDEIRISSGVARYSKSIERFANTFVAKGDTGDAFTALQIQSNGAKNGTGYSSVLNETGSLVVTVSGDPTWLTKDGDPLGGANTALYFDGVGDSLSIASGDFDIGDAYGDNTIEMWLRPHYNGTQASPMIWGIDNDNVQFAWSNSAYHHYWNTGNGLTSGNTGPGSVRDRTWHHLAWVFRKRKMEVYVDGVLKNTNAFTSDSTAANIKVFVHPTSSDNYFTGYLDQFRISNGVARYGKYQLRTTQQTHVSANSDSGVVTSNSTFGTGEATIPYSSDAYTALLLNGDEVYGSGTTFPATKSASLGANTGTVITVTKGDGTTTSTYPALRQGMSAFGANSYYFDGGDYLKVAASADWNLAGTKTWTLEWWMRTNNTTASWARVIQHAQQSGAGWCVRFYDNDAYIGFTRSDRNESQLQNSSATMANNVWYHCAFQNDYSNGKSSAAYFLNGKKVAEGNLANTHTSGLSPAQNYNEVDNEVLWIGQRGGENDYYYEGSIDSLRISQGVARYGFSGTNTKVGTNVAHHSHCKLLITSNTFHGNTHFDDFSDQGNYWNQQPYSYFFDGTDAYLDVPNGVSSYDSLSSHYMTICAWVKPDRGARGNHQFYVSNDTRASGTNNQYYIYTNSSNVPGASIEGPSPGLSLTTGSDITVVNYDDWNLFTYTINGTTEAKYYINGVEWSSDTSYGGTLGAASAGLNIGGSALVPLYVRCQIAQVGVWEGSSSGHPLSAANIQSIWEAGPTANWMTDYSTNMHCYLAMGNHNDLAERPADDVNKVYDRSGNGNDGTASGIEMGPNKGNQLVQVVKDSVQHVTDVKKFGSSSYYFQGRSGTTVDMIRLRDHDMVRPGPNDFTIECWYKPSAYSPSATAIKDGAIFETSQNSSTIGVNLQIKDGTTQVLAMFNTGKGWICETPAGALTAENWHHIVGMQKDQKLMILVDGKVLATAAGQNYTASGSDRANIGHSVSQDIYLIGYMDEFAYYECAKYNPVATGLGSATITPSYLDDPTGNHFTTSGLAITDQMLDTPENNFCTWNIIHPTVSRSSPAMMAGEGNLQVQGTGAQWNPVFGSMGFTAGKWYYEIKVVTLGTTEPRFQFGWGAHDVISKTAFADGDNDQTSDPASSLSDYVVLHSWGDQGYCAGGGTTVGYATIPTDGLSSVPVVGDILMLAADLDNTRFSLGLNGIWYGNINPGDGDSNFSTTNVSGGTGAVMRDSSVVGHYTPFGFLRDASSGTNATPKIIANFGQGDPDGENNYADSNSRGGFRFEPPSGFLSLCTANMKDADFAPIGPNSAAGTPDKHFDTLIWSGDGTSDRRIGGLNFQPDLVWGKVRDGDYSQALFDSVRGVGKQLYPDSTAVEASVEGVTSFNADGVTVGSNRDFGNESGKEYVAWCWKAGNDTVVDSSGKITVTRSTNTDAGFTIGTYKGTQVSDDTIAHGLGKTPEFIIFKNRDAADNWTTWHQNLTAGNNLVLDLNNAQGSSGALQSPYVDSSFIYLGGTGDSPGDWVSTNTSGENFVFYAWTEIEGFSKFGSYVGNANADGPFIYTGFRPAFIMAKNITDAREWWMIDTKRDGGVNGTNQRILYPHLPDVEDTGLRLDMLSNGFKIRTTSDHWNETGDTFIYMAFAEMPFKYATAR